MNATWMLRLYPTAWRARYETEFQALLEDQRLSVLDTLDIAFGAFDAHLHPQRNAPLNQPAIAGAGGPMNAPSPDRVHRAKQQLFWFKLFAAHAALFMTVVLACLAINLATGTPPHWWAYVLWGWAMPLALHAGVTFPRIDAFGTHLALFAIVNAGLATINATVASDSPWSLWVLASTGILLIAHAALRMGIVDVFGAHVILTVLVIAEVGAVYAIVPALGIPDLLQISVAAVIPLVVHALIRHRTVGFYPGHVLVWSLLLATLAGIDVTDDSGTWWFQYPLVVGLIILAAHTLVRFRVVGFPDSEWESATLARLHAQADDDDRPELDSAVRARRGLLTHLFCFGVGVLCLLVLNIMSTPDVPWSVWPIAGWIGLLSVHAGAVSIRPALLGIHIGGTLVLVPGLAAINLGVGGDTFWAIWPIGGLSLLLAIHAVLVFGRQRLREWEEDRLSQMLN